MIKRIISKIKNFFWNKKYTKGSLYGGGVFPFWIYIKYFGKPVYKFCRRHGLSKYSSLTAAHILGALFHVTFFVGGFTKLTVCLFIFSFMVFPPAFWLLHMSYKFGRKHLL